MKAFSMLVLAVALMVLGVRLWTSEQHSRFKDSSPTIARAVPGNVASSPAVLAASSSAPHQSNPNTAISSAGRGERLLHGLRKRAWDRKFLDNLSGARVGGNLRFPLVDSQIASGVITELEQGHGQFLIVSGKLSEPEPGRFFFHRQTRPGLA